MAAGGKGRSTFSSKRRQATSDDVCGPAPKPAAAVDAHGCGGCSLVVVQGGLGLLCHQSLVCQYVIAHRVAALGPSAGDTLADAVRNALSRGRERLAPEGCVPVHEVAAGKASTRCMRC